MKTKAGWPVAVTAVMALGGVGFLAAAAVEASNTPPELQWVHDEIARLLPGEYDAYPQIHIQRLLGAPPDGEHEHWHRVFQRIEVPQIGETVFYGQLRVGGRDGAIMPGTQILYSLVLDEASMSVTLNGRRIADPSRFEDAHLHREMWPQLAIDPRYGGSCNFRWRLNGEQVVGRLEEDGTCTHVSRVTGQAYTWDAEWVLTDDALWIFDNGYLEDGSMFIGRHDRVHHRLSRTRDFACQLGEGRNAEPLVIHDRGEWRDLASADGDARRLQLLRARLPRPGRAVLVEQTSLAVYDGDTLLAETRVEGAPERIMLRHDDLTVDCLRLP